MSSISGECISAFRKNILIGCDSFGFAQFPPGNIGACLAAIAVLMLFPGVLISQEGLAGRSLSTVRGSAPSTVERFDFGLRGGDIESSHVDETAPLRAGHALTSAFSLPMRLAASTPDTGVTRDPASSSLFLMPTGRTLPAVSGTLGLAAPYIPYASLSLLPGLQLSAGGVYIFESDEGDDRAYYSYAMLKNSLYEDKNTSIAVGAAVLFWGQQFKLGGRTNWDRVALPGAFGVATIGGEESAFTFGIGMAEMAGGFGLGFDEGLLVGIGLGYETRLSPQWKLMTEHLSNLLAAGTLHTLGFRYFTGRAAFDLGLIVIPNGDITISGKKIPLVLPLLGVSIHIG